MTKIRIGKPVLAAMGQNIFYTGDLGTGQVAKLCNHMAGATLLAISSEASNLMADTAEGNISPETNTSFTALSQIHTNMAAQNARSSDIEAGGSDA